MDFLWKSDPLHIPYVLICEYPRPIPWVYTNPLSVYCTQPSIDRATITLVQECCFLQSVHEWYFEFQNMYCVSLHMHQFNSIHLIVLSAPPCVLYPALYWQGYNYISARVLIFAISTWMVHWISEHVLLCNTSHASIKRMDEGYEPLDLGSLELYFRGLYGNGIVGSVYRAIARKVISSNSLSED